MGNCFRLPDTPHKTKVLRVAKIDGKCLEYKTPMLVKDILINFSAAGFGIGLSKKPLTDLPHNYKLKIGRVYYLFPLMSSSFPTSVTTTMDDDDGTSSGSKRIKLIITKRELQELLSKKIPVEETCLLHINRKDSNAWCGPNIWSRWRPVLETIPEGSVWRNN